MVMLANRVTVEAVQLLTEDKVEEREKARFLRRGRRGC